MFPLVRSLTVRYLLQKWDRSLLVALSIALGVATVVSARLLNQCVEIAVLDTTVPVDVADLYVDNGEAGVQRSLVDEIRKAKVPGLRRAEPTAIFSVTLPALESRTARLIGAELPRPTSTDPLVVYKEFDEGVKELEKRLRVKITIVNLVPNAILISRKLYEDLQARGFQNSDLLEIRYTTQTQKFRVGAVVDVEKFSPLAPYANTLVGVDINSASRLMSPPGPENRTINKISRVDIFVEDGADLDDVKGRVAGIVGSKATVRKKEEIRKSTAEVISGLRLVLNLCGVGALIVGLFLVYNSLSVTVAERRHDIGVMRSLGATRGQIARLFTVEAVILGALGSLPGIPLGIGLARLTISLFSSELKSIFPGGGLFQPEISWQLAVVAVAAGMITALFAALVPALQAASDEPANAVRRTPGKKGGVVRFIHRASCLALVTVGAATVFLRTLLPGMLGALTGIALILIGLFLAMPIFVGWLAAFLHPLLRPWLGVEARLAADNLVRAPARTGVVIGALGAGVCLMALTAGVGKSNEVPIREWLGQVMQADAYVFRGDLASANSSINPMESKDREELKAVPGVSQVVGFRFYRPEFRGTYVLLIGIDARDYHQGIRARAPTGLPKLDLFDRLPDGNHALVSENFAEKWKVREGDTITVPSSRGPVDLKVVGIGLDYSWNQGTIFVDRTRYKELFDDTLVDAYHVFFDLSADQEKTYKAVQQHVDRKDLLVQDRESVTIYLASVIERMLLLGYMQQLLVAVVASLGVVTSLLISVLQRKRELGLIRAVGATQPQVIRTVLAEALFMGVLGTIIGFLLGLPLEWFLLNIVVREETGFQFELLVPWKEAFGIGIVCVVTATLAGMIPAIRAARLRITDAIAYE